MIGFVDLVSHVRFLAYLSPLPSLFFPLGEFVFKSPGYGFSGLIVWIFWGVEDMDGTELRDDHWCVRATFIG